VAFYFFLSGGSSEMSTLADIRQFQLNTGASSVMVARAAQWNPSIFSKDGVEPIDDVIRKYIQYVCQLVSTGHCMSMIFHVCHITRCHLTSGNRPTLPQCGKEDVVPCGLHSRDVKCWCWWGGWCIIYFTKGKVEKGGKLGLDQIYCFLGPDFTVRRNFLK